MLQQIIVELMFQQIFLKLLLKLSLRKPLLNQSLSMLQHHKWNPLFQQKARS